MCGAEFFGRETGRLHKYVCEQWRTTQNIQAIDISRFPENLRNAFYEDKGKPPDKWIKPHECLNVSSKYSAYSGIRTIYAPSASGEALGIGGYVVAADPSTQPMELIGTVTFSSMISAK